MKTGNTFADSTYSPDPHIASMEPGHEDREYPRRWGVLWSSHDASMEPGHEDREYSATRSMSSCPSVASMEPGHEDREYHPSGCDPSRHTPSLNGARS